VSSAPIIHWPYIILLCIGLLFGSAPFIGRLRTMPRWIRIALLVAGLSFLVGGVAAAALDWAGGRLSPSLHRFIYGNVLALFGSGSGIILFLAISGEIFKALRTIDSARHREMEERDTRNV
jgi:hypothetical protein